MNLLRWAILVAAAAVLALPAVSLAAGDRAGTAANLAQADGGAGRSRYTGPGAIAAAAVHIIIALVALANRKPDNAQPAAPPTPTNEERRAAFEKHVKEVTSGSMVLVIFGLAMAGRMMYLYWKRGNPGALENFYLGMAGIAVPGLVYWFLSGPVGAGSRWAAWAVTVLGGLHVAALLVLLALLWLADGPTMFWTIGLGVPALLSATIAHGAAVARKNARRDGPGA